MPPHGAQRAGCGEQAGAPTCILASGTSLPARRPAWCTGSEWVYAWGPQFRWRKLRVPGPGRPVVDVRCARPAVTGAVVLAWLIPSRPALPACLGPALRAAQAAAPSPTDARVAAPAQGGPRSPPRQPRSSPQVWEAFPRRAVHPGASAAVLQVRAPPGAAPSPAEAPAATATDQASLSPPCRNARRPSPSGTHGLLPLHRGRHPPLTPDPTSTRCLSSVSSRTLRPFARTEIPVFLRTHLMYKNSEAQTVLLSRAQAAGLPNPLPPLCGGWGRL